ncbi:MAG: tRNA guanosine(34) transglycosylase Tgt [Bacteroidales bacterium]|nr:tRNA guanosine(34) transglycosylase Tgt [Bacteroidales bacterium]
MIFKVEYTDKNSKARAGILYTDRGIIETPIFMPVATVGTVKGVLQSQLHQEIKAQIILSNTYHLYLRPGIEVIKKARGLHNFIGWNKPILTDSGGYQVFSLAKIRKITNEGVKFLSHIDGSQHFFTPHLVIDIQRILGSDIIMPLDECTPYPCSYEYAKNSMDMTLRWFDNAYQHFIQTNELYNHKQYLFPIIQGSVYDDLRRYNLEKALTYEIPGIAIGGLSVGEPDDDMYRIVDLITTNSNRNLPHYLMGVGTPENILECIALGIDMFDCVLPTRNGRNGMIFTTQGIINIKNAKWATDFSPIDDFAISFVDSYTKAYLHHLFKADEMLGPIIASIHNLSFYIWLVKQARCKIIEGVFYEWKNKVLPTFMQRL